MRLEIFSDTICPWCFVGKRRLERAIRQRPQPGLVIRWRAFQLNPGMAAEGMDRKTYLDLKFGGRERAARVYEAVTTAGRGENIAFAFDRIKRTPNTLDSHRLLRFADEERQDDLAEALFVAYFTTGADIGDRRVLADIAVGVGLDRAAVSRFLDSRAEVDAVLAEDALARRQGINGVPCFVFNGRFALSGAQEPEALFQLFDLSREDDQARIEASQASVGA
jgi:predicted DsbA family dithiol-disulfide isomerase